MSTEQLESYMSEMLITNEEIKVLENHKEKLRTQILLLVKELNIQEHKNDTMRLTLKTSKRNSLDKMALEDYLQTQNKSVDDFKTETEFETLKVVRLGEVD